MSNANVTKSTPLPAEPREDILQLHKLFAMLSGIYVETCQIAKHIKMEKAWNDIAGIVTDDLGALTQVWEAARSRASLNKKHVAAPISLVELSKRFEKLQTALHLWVPLDRKARILQVLEKQWLKAIQSLGDPEFLTSEGTNELIQNSHLRLRHLSAFAVHHKEFKAKLIENYAAPKSLVH